MSSSYTFPAPFDGACPPDLPLQKLLGIFFSLLRIRRVEEEIERRYARDEMKTPIHLSIGQEAIAVGICEALERKDVLFTSHRSHAPYLAKGGDLKAMLAELHCRATGCAGSRGGSMHLVDRAAGVAGGSAIVGGAVPLATGAALASKLRGESGVSAVFFGDGATEEGVVWESLNFAALKKLPVLFVCENNFYSVCSPLSKRQSDREIHDKARAFGVEAELVNGVDVLAVRTSATRLVARARQGEGPGFLEARAYRWRGHGGAGEDTALGYRSAEELALWKERCPVEIYAVALERLGILPQSSRERMEEEIRVEIDGAFAWALSSPVPPKKDVCRFVYCDGEAEAR